MQEIICALPEDKANEENELKEGYAVKFEDGSWSWMSKEAFEDIYLPEIHVANPPIKK